MIRYLYLSSSLLVENSHHLCDVKLLSLTIDWYVHCDDEEIDIWPDVALNGSKIIKWSWFSCFCCCCWFLVFSCYSWTSFLITYVLYVFDIYKLTLVLIVPAYTCCQRMAWKMVTNQGDYLIILYSRKISEYD